MEMKNLTPIRLPLRKICSDNADFDIKAARMETFFASRGYPDDVIRRGRDQALTKSRVQILKCHCKQHRYFLSPLSIQETWLP